MIMKDMIFNIINTMNGEAETDNHQSEVQSVIQQAEANEKNNTGKTALMLAGFYGVSVPKELLDESRLGEKDDHGMTALMHACSPPHRLFGVILELPGADLYARDNNQKTVLMYACESGDLEGMKSLLAKGVDRTAKDANEKTACDYADCYDRQKVINILQNNASESTSNESELEESNNGGISSLPSKLKVVKVSKTGSNKNKSKEKKLQRLIASANRKTRTISIRNGD